MKRKRFSEEQIIQALKQVDAGAKVADICRQHGIAEGTYYRWKEKFGGMNVSDAKRLKMLEDENKKLKRKVAELVMDNDALREINSKNW